MTKNFKLQDLGCANCAAKMETAICKLPGVQTASISFMTQRLTLEAPDDQFGDILEKAKKLIRRIEPDVRVVG